MYVNYIVFTVLCVDMDALAYFAKELLCVAKKYIIIHFRLEKRLNFAFLLWMSDLFWDCEIKSYLYFGLNHNILFMVCRIFKQLHL